MKHKLFMMMMVVAVVAIAIGMWSPQSTPAIKTWAQVPDGLVALAADEAPELDGIADDAVWADATAVEIDVAGGSNSGETVVTVKSAYADDMVYFLVTWEDPTESFLRSPWELQEDGTWIQLKDPDDTYHDNNLWYEDKLSFIWPINNSIPGFEAAGCFATCHAGENSDFKPYGNKYTDEEGQMGDIWHWKSVRNLGQAHDQYLDSVRFSEDTPSAGRHGDPSESGGYVNNKTEDGLPAWMGGEDFPRDGSPGYILEDEKVEFDAALFEAGDRIPGITKSPFVGDAGAIMAGWMYEDGVWTVELGRALVTGSEYDVQFDDLTATYYFGVATFDNAQVRHAFQVGSTPFSFAQ